MQTLGFKAAFLGGHFWRPLPDGGRYMDYLALDSELDYDPVWAKCVELGVVPASHVGTLGGPTHGSITNYTFNHAGSFAAAGHILARALILGGVMHRFPKLRVAFLEGGAGWAFAPLQHPRRALREAQRPRDPAHPRSRPPGPRADAASCSRSMAARCSSRYAARIGRDEGTMLNPPEDRAKVDDFAATGAETAEEFARQFVDGFYFGCEGEDRATVMAFDRRLNHFGHQLNAIFSSDLGHWDVPDMAMSRRPTSSSRTDSRETSASSPLTSRDVHVDEPDFFKGTAVESAVAEDDGQDR